ncbi:MAG: branched-chain amino acid ABC transporter permease [Burkholderiaceae bacterium]|jgi:branched-chain amino acid transport system permease protein|nr:branched-chain amino acid ABC transporter permease [Burkholderiaceae bacterium]
MSPQRRTTIATVAVLASLPLWASDFWLANVMGQALALGLVVLSLNFLAGLGGMVSMAQMTVAGCAGYALALTSANAVGMGQVLPPLLSLAAALAAALTAGTVIGAIAVRSAGIYLLMLTLALGMGFFYFVQQNTAVFNAFDGISGVAAPRIAGVSVREPALFYAICLLLSLAAYAAVRGLAQSPFGLVLQALRDHPAKARALGFDTARHRVAAFALAALPAGTGGVLYTWFNERISPSTVGLGMLNAVLIMGVIGGLGHPVGAFVGALAYVLLNTFAGEFVGVERFNTLVGMVFVFIVLASPGGLVGLASRWRHWRQWCRRSGPALPEPPLDSPSIHPKET